MKRWLVQSIAPFATAAMIVAFAALCGCERQPAAPVDRRTDPVYKKQLAQARAQQNKQAAVRSRIAGQMEELVARARGALPPNATDAQLKAELEGNPAKYPGWKALSAALEKANANLDEELAKARALVRARIMKDAAAGKASVGKGAAAKKPAAAK